MPAFLDEARIHVHAGDGGGGAAHFRREKFVPLGGPDGGDGGDGGSIFLRAVPGLNTLFDFKRKRRFTAEPGGPGGAARMHGRNGKDLVIQVPVGTVVRDDSGALLGDLTQPEQMLQVARGGKGGLGNVHFKSSTNQAPGFAEKGEPGEERALDLELKLIADVGIIGVPNAGKSTVLSVISAARPKIADYPFTTLVPNLGVVVVDDYSFVAADIPGLIEGASEGVGLGHEFLRHIERTMVLLHVVDGSAPDPMATYHEVLDELTAHDAALAERPQLIVVNKMDLPAAQEQWPGLETAFQRLGFDVFAVSAATREGFEPLLYRTAELCRRESRARTEEQEHQAAVEVITIPPPPDHFEIERQRKTFYVRGETVERLAVMTDLNSDEAMYRLQQRLKRMGVFTALERAGVEEGSTVRIGDVELIWDSSYEPSVKAERNRAPGRRRRS